MAIRVKNKIRIRLLSILFLMITSSLGVYVILSNLQDNIVFFYPPSELSKIETSKRKVRVGGLVKDASINQNFSGEIQFTITDNKADLVIEYKGLLPALFRPNQGVVAEGKLLPSGIFIATKLLTKHDESYKPPSS